MIQAFYTSAAGMSAQQTNLDVIANNISNINTPGYRVRRAEFSELLTRESAGYGVKVGAVSLIPFPESVNPLKMVITGQGGYFAVADDAGNRAYTTNGDFKLIERGGRFYLGTKDGKFVLDSSFRRIELTNNASDAVVVNGVIYPDGDIGGEGLPIAVVRFADTAALALSGSGVFSETAASGPPIPHEFAMAAPGYFDELAPVMMERQMGETINVVRAQMAYSFNSRALQIADDMEAMANHLRY
ncbi:MAG: flagellar hook-basal body complex protein [Clostridiales bacterium]|nr:flagellar hook-basal body complex protein [Clostridiales bacterium]